MKSLLGGLVALLAGFVLVVAPLQAGPARWGWAVASWGQVADAPAAPAEPGAPPEPAPVDPGPAPMEPAPGPEDGPLPNTPADPVPTTPAEPSSPEQSGPVPTPPVEPPVTAPAEPGPTKPEPPAPPSDPPRPIHGVATAGAKEVVLTFDDGPSIYTAELLRILADEKVPAAFFWIAKGNQFPLASEVVRQGHQLGSHSVTHARLPGMARAGQEAEIAHSKAVLEAFSGAPVKLFRPPYGAYDQETLRIAQEQQLATVLWNVDSRDWDLADKPQQIIQNVLAQVKPGSIILLHERKQTTAVLPQLIQALRDAGYGFRLLPVEG